MRPQIEHADSGGSNPHFASIVCMRTLAMSGVAAVAQIGATSLLARFYVAHLPTLYRLPTALKNPEVLGDVMAARKPFEMRVDAAPARAYNADLKALKAEVKALGPGSPLAFRGMFAVFVLLRLLCIANAALFPHHVAWSVALGALQFLFMPYSFFVSVTQLLAIAPALFVGHLVTFAPLQLVTSLVLPEWMRLFVPINATFVWIFFITDQLH